MSMVKTKTATLCFFGQARTLDRCYPYIKKNLLDPLGKAGKDYDIFCCVEDDEDAYKADLLNPTKLLKVKPEETNKILKRDLDFLNKYNYRKFIYRIGPRVPYPMVNLLQLFYKKKLCYDLMERHIQETGTKYKYYIRSRFDMVFIEKINLKNIKIKSDEILVPKNDEIKKHNGIDDCFAITSNLESFKVYCGMINNLKPTILKFHSIKLSFFKRLYFAFEKKYKSLIIKLFKENKNLNMLFSLLTMIPDGIFYKSMRKKTIGSHVLLASHVKSKGKKIKYLRLDYAIIRKNYKGILSVGK